MTLADVMAIVMWTGVTLYVLLGGADFGAGLWHMLAGSASKGVSQRRLIEHSIGPVWEVNHVWLIFVLVITWTCFPTLYGSIASTLWIPFTLAAFGIIARGSALAFRRVVQQAWQRRIFGVIFALSSVVTPFFFGTMIGALTLGRVPTGVGGGNEITSWFNPSSLIIGLLAVTACAFLAAVYLTVDARRSKNMELVAAFRNRALGAEIITCIVAASAIFALHSSAPTFVHGLTHKALTLVIISGLAGVVTFIMLCVKYFTAARILAVITVAVAIWGWAAAQYPHVLNSSLTLAQAASEPAVLRATLASVCIGAVILIPSLGWLYILFQREDSK